MIKVKTDMRVSDNCFLALELLLLICIFDSDLGRAFWPSDTTIHSGLVVRYHSADRPDSTEKILQINLEKEIRYDSSVGAASEHKNIILTGRKLLMKLGVSQEEVKSNTGNINNHSMKKISHGRTSKRRSKSIKHLKNRGHQRDEGSVGAFTEDYRVPRPHPPRNN